MKLQYLRAFIVLLAGLITLIINMKTGRPVVLSLFIVLIVLLVFYVIGTLTVEIIQKGLKETDDEDTKEISTAIEDDADVEGEQQEVEDNAVAFSFDVDE